MAIVTLDRISKRFAGGGPPAVDDISLTVKDGEFMVLLGPSGCGKSTTLRMIAGLEPITAGTLTIDGEVMNRVPAKNRDIAMVFQSYALYPHMTVRDNLAFGLRRRSVAKAEVRRRVDAVAELLGLTPFLDRRPYALSGGQRQRVALGRAIVRDPKVFLFDEPLSNLDAALRVRTRNELIRQYQRLRATMIYVTHDQVEAMTMGTRICIMNRGKIVQVGQPLEVYRNPANTFVASFIGSPPMNLIKAEIGSEAGRLVARFAGRTFSLPGYAEQDVSGLADRQVVVGFRPEDILLACPDAANANRYASLETAAVAAEPLGAETLLIVSLAGDAEELVARVGRDVRVISGQPLPVYFDLAQAHLFDPQTTRALPKTGQGGAFAA
jgi:multiple sugar transport system ATP-binding protein